MDEEISQGLGIDVKEARKILHRLHDLSLVIYEILRDKDTGHRIFKWRVQPDQIAGFARMQIRKITERLKERLRYEQSHELYFCGTPDCRKYTFEEAYDSLFKCKKCGKQLEHFDNSEVIEAIKLKLAQLEKEESSVA